MIAANNKVFKKVIFITSLVITVAIADGGSRPGGRPDLLRAFDADWIMQAGSSRRDMGVEDLADHSPFAIDFQQMEEVGEGDA